MFIKPGISITNLTKREKRMVFALLLVFLVFLNYRCLLVPQIQSYRTLKPELSKVKAQVTQMDVLAASIQSESDAVKAVDHRLEKARAKFSVNRQDGSTLFLLGQWAIKDKVIITSYQPGMVSNKGVYLELPLRIGLRGDYLDVLTLVERVEEAANLVEIRYLDIKPYRPPSFEKAGAQQGAVERSVPLPQDGTVTAELNLVMYSEVTPQGQLILDEMSRWPVGKGNAFLSSQENIPKI